LHKIVLIRCEMVYVSILEQKKHKLDKTTIELGLNVPDYADAH